MPDSLNNFKLGNYDDTEYDNWKNEQTIDEFINKKNQTLPTDERDVY